MKEILAKLYLNFVIYIPIIALILFGIINVYYLIVNPFFVGHEKFFFEIDIGAATLAGLSFYASYTSKDEERKRVYYELAEKFFHATVLMTMGTIIEATIIYLKPVYSPGIMMDGLIKIMIFSVIIFLVMAFVNLSYGLIMTLKFLYKNTSHERISQT